MPELLEARPTSDEPSSTSVDLRSGAQIMWEERRFNYAIVGRSVEAEISSTAC